MASVHPSVTCVQRFSCGSQTCGSWLLPKSISYLLSFPTYDGYGAVFYTHLEISFLRLQRDSISQMVQKFWWDPRTLVLLFINRDKHHSFGHRGRFQLSTDLFFYSRLSPRRGSPEWFWPLCLAKYLSVSYFWVILSSGSSLTLYLWKEWQSRGWQ